MDISKKQILLGDSDALQRLLTISYIPPDYELDNQAISAESCQTIAQYLLTSQQPLLKDDSELKVLLANLKQEFPKLTATDLSYIRFCLEITLVFQRATPLDSALSKLIERLQKLVLVHSLYHIDFWIKPYALKEIIDQLCLAMMGWQSDFGQHSESFFNLLQNSIQTLESFELSAEDAFKQAENTIKQELAELQAFSHRFAERMKSAELGKIKNQSAQYAVLSNLNQLLLDKWLPPIISSYIQGELASMLHQLLAVEGLEAKKWQQIKPVLSDLVEIYQPEYQLREKDKVLATKLQAILFGLEIPSESAQQFIDNISFDLTQLAQGIKVADAQQTSKLDIPEHLQAMQAVASQDLIKRANQAKEGQWFLFKTETGELRCQLLANLCDYQRVLFSNFIGQRALVTSYDEFAYLVATQKLQALPIHGPVIRCLHTRLDNLLENYQSRLAQHQSQQELRQQEEKARQEQAIKAAAAEKARLEAQEIARQRAEAARKAEQERLALEQERIAREQEQRALEKAEQEERVKADLRRHARLSLDSLTLGSWAEYIINENPAIRIKLAVKFAATGRFIFVDDDGITVLEEHRDNLVEMLLNGQLHLLESDKRFAERLAKIVSDLRTS